MARLLIALAGGGDSGGGARVYSVLDDVNYVVGMVLPRQRTLAMLSSLAKRTARVKNVGSSRSASAIRARGFLGYER